MTRAASIRALIGRRADLAILLLLILFGSLLRFHDLDGKSLWRDEVETQIIAEKEYAVLTELALKVPYIPVPPLYFYATRLCCHQLPGRRSLRWPAALFGVLLIPAVWLLGREVATRSVGCIAAAATAVAPFFVRYSQEARSYTLVAFLVAMSIYFMARAARRGGFWNWCGWAAATILGLYSHHFAWLAVGVTAVYFVSVRWRAAAEHGGLARSLLGSWPAWLAVFAAYLPMLGYIIRGLTGPRGLALGAARITFRWSDIEAILSVVGPAGAPVMWAVAALAVAGAAASAPWRPGGRGLVLLWIGLPLLIAAVPFAHAMRLRYLIFVMPAYFLLAAAGAVWLAGRLGRKTLAVVLVTALALVVAASALAGVRRYYREGKQDWKSAACFLERVAAPGDIVLVDGRGVKWLNVRFRVLKYYASAGREIWVFNDRFDIAKMVKYGNRRQVRFWYVNTLTRQTGGPEGFLASFGKRLGEHGWMLLPPLKFDAKVYESPREVRWIGPTRYRSLLVVPLVPKEGVDAVSETGRLLAEARGIRRATVDEAYTRRLLKGAGTR